MKNKPTNEERRKQNYLKTWGIKDGPHNPDLRNIIRNAVDEADYGQTYVDGKIPDYQQKVIDFIKGDKVTTPPKKIDVDSITASRLRYERLMRGDND